MSLPIWTPGALSSEARALRGTCWRLVEAQHRVSTLKLVDTLAEQTLLETLLEETKPPVPPECRDLHYLLSTPFRYGAPYPKGSRFRRAGFTEGVYYASARVETAVAEIAFHRLLFFAEAPGVPFPANALEFTAFAVPYRGPGLDLMRPPFAAQRALWTDPVDYGPCQHLAEAARAARLSVIRTESVRDPAEGANIALLACTAFAAREPRDWQSWSLGFGPVGAWAVSAFPDRRLEFSREGFGDPRLAS
jgi:hypothetical protein